MGAQDQNCWDRRPLPGSHPPAWGCMGGPRSGLLGQAAAARHEGGGDVHGGAQNWESGRCLGHARLHGNAWGRGAAQKRGGVHGEADTHLHGAADGRECK